MLQKKKLVMGQVDPKGLPCHKSRALAPVFTKKTPHSHHNHEVNPTNFSVVELYFHEGARGLMTNFDPFGPKRLCGLHIQNPSSFFQN